MGRSFWAWMLGGCLILLFAQADAQSLTPTPGHTASKSKKAAPKAAKKPSDPTSSPTPAASPGPWVLEIGPAVTLPIQNWNPAYTFGYGSSLRLGCRLDSQWVLGLGLDYYHFSGTNFAGTVSDNDLRILPRLLCYFGSGKFRTYGTLEAGAAFQFADSLPGSFTNFNFDGGIGVGAEQSLGPRDSLYLEARYNCILAGGVLGQDLSLGLGYRTGL